MFDDYFELMSIAVEMVASEGKTQLLMVLLASLDAKDLAVIKDTAAVFTKKSITPQVLWVLFASGFHAKTVAVFLTHANFSFGYHAWNRGYKHSMETWYTHILEVVHEDVHTHVPDLAYLAGLPWEVLEQIALETGTGCELERGGGQPIDGVLLWELRVVHELHKDELVTTEGLKVVSVNTAALLFEVTDATKDTMKACKPIAMHVYKELRKGQQRGMLPRLLCLAQRRALERLLVLHISNHVLTVDLSSSVEAGVQAALRVRHRPLYSSRLQVRS